MPIKRSCDNCKQNSICISFKHALEAVGPIFDMDEREDMVGFVEILRIMAQRCKHYDS